MKRARLLPAYVEIMLAAGESEDARGACRELEGIAHAYRTEALETMVAESWGVTLLADGDAEAALVWLRKAWQGWQSLEAPYDAARIRVSLGGACRALGDDDGARLEVEAARSTFEGLGAAPDLDRIESLTRPAPHGAGHGLTPREMEVLASLATGKTNRAIAADLFISEKTVARHVSNILMKLRVRSRAAATAYAYEHDLL
jgi:DNA-binding CsgD family transcriptional regulator